MEGNRVKDTLDAKSTEFDVLLDVDTEGKITQERFSDLWLGCLDRSLGMSIEELVGSGTGQEGVRNLIWVFLR